MRDIPFLCDGAEVSASAYIDEELAPEDRVEFEGHLAACTRCARLVNERGALKAKIKSGYAPAALSPELSARIMAALDREAPHAARPRFGRLLTVLPAAVAVAILAFAIAGTHHHVPVAAEALRRHQLDLPIEVSGGDDLVGHWFDRKLDFAARPPHLSHAALVGARLANIQDHLAADFVYEVDGKKVSVFVFDPRDLDFAAPHRRKGGGREVLLDGDHGYHVAMFQDHGVAYALTSELSEDAVFELASSALTP